MRRLKTIIPARNSERIEQLILPGFEGVPLSEVLRFIVKGLQKGVLVTRASSIAFNILMALLPSSIFLFSLIPFIPIPNFQVELIKLFENILPANAYGFLEATIVDVITRKSSTFLIFMFFATVIFSTNGIHALINAFVVSAHPFNSRSWVDQRKISVVLLMIMVTLVFTAGCVLIAGRMGIDRLVELHIIRSGLVYYIVLVLKSIVNVGLLFLAISFLYWLAPAKRSDFRFFSPGSIVATVLFILTSLGFSAYVNAFGQYNRLYGGIGTLIVIMLWLYLNSISLLLGFELNVSIKAANAEITNQKCCANHSEDTA